VVEKRDLAMPLSPTALVLRSALRRGLPASRRAPSSAILRPSGARGSLGGSVRGGRGNLLGVCVRLDQSGISMDLWY